MKTPYKNSHGEIVEITHVVVIYYLPVDDNKRLIVLPVDEANEFVNRKGIYGPYVSEAINKNEAIKRGYFK